MAPLITPTINKKAKDVVEITPLAHMSLRIWKKILRANRGSSFTFILSQLPAARDIMFVDAATEWGIGGCCGNVYFAYSWERLTRFFNVDYIARMELLAAVVAIDVFKDKIRGKWIHLYSDNTNVVAWLRKGRSSNMLGMRMLSC